MPTAALIVAAGRGSRAAASGPAPKQYVALGGKPVLAHAVGAFLDHPGVDLVLVVIHPDDAQLYRRAIADEDARLLAPTFGGLTRQESVRLGLEALRRHAPTHVLIHDAARPFVERVVLDRVLALLATHDGAIAALPLTDTLKRAEHDDMIAGTIDRAGLWRAQTPQGFGFERILAAHATAAAAGRSDFTDDAAVAESAGLRVALALGSERNVKLTTPEDIAMAERMLASARSGPAREVRTGSGFDVHRFAPGDGVWLCGVKLPHSASLEGHSDADVALHALTDALLGAIGAGDIGQHFPPSDPQWKGAASHVFLRHACKLLAERGGRITNVDITILAEAPKVAPHRAELCASVAEILALDRSRVSVKATTTEGLGFTGRREGIAAMATATVTLPAD